MTHVMTLLRLETGLELLEALESLWSVVNGTSAVPAASKVLTLPVGVVLEKQ